MGKVQTTIDVNAPVDICYGLWSDFSQLTRFMKHVKSIVKSDKGNDTWTWTVDGPLGSNISWDAEVGVRDENDRIGWHSVEGSTVENRGAVTFRPTNANTTNIEVIISYDPPAGAVGEAVAQLFSNPNAMVEEDLNNFKQLAESQVAAGAASSY